MCDLRDAGHLPTLDWDGLHEEGQEGSQQRRTHFNVVELTDLLRRDFSPRAIEAVAAIAARRDVGKDSHLSRDEFAGFLEDLYAVTGSPQPPDETLRQQVVQCFRQFDPSRTKRLGPDALCAFLRASHFRDVLGPRWRPAATAGGQKTPPRRSQSRSPSTARTRLPPTGNDEETLLEALRSAAIFGPPGCDVAVARGVVRAWKASGGSGKARSLAKEELAKFFRGTAAVLALPPPDDADVDADVAAALKAGGGESATAAAALTVLQGQKWRPLLSDAAGRRKRIRGQYDYSVDAQGGVHSPEERQKALLEWRRGVGASAFPAMPADEAEADAQAELAYTLHAWTAGLRVAAETAEFELVRGMVPPAEDGDAAAELSWAVLSQPNQSAPPLREIEGLSLGAVMNACLPEQAGYVKLADEAGWLKLAADDSALLWKMKRQLHVPPARAARKELRRRLWQTRIAIRGRRQDAVLLPIRSLGLHLTREETRADLLWTREDVSIPKAKDTPREQLLTSFAGMREFARKIPFNRHLQRMSRFFPDRFDFVPRTWNMPEDFADLKATLARGRGCPHTFIVKPSAGSEGKGIYLTQDLSALDEGAADVVQEYVEPPMLWDGLKFDLRIYVLVTCLRPLRCRVFEDGLARLATEQYQEAEPGNLKNFYMHLTNYSLNKDAPNFQENVDADEDAVGHKRSLRAFWAHLEEQGRPVAKIQRSINQLILNTLAALSPGLAVLRDAVVAQEDRDWLQKCTHLIGFDVMLDKWEKPWIIEINSRPSLGTDAPIDLNIKTQVVEGMLLMATHDAVSRQEGADGLWVRAAAQVDEDKLHPGGRGGRGVPRAGLEETARALRAARDQYEAANCGRWRPLYPSKDFPTDSVGPLEVFSDELQAAFEKACGVRCRHAMSSARFVVFARAVGIISDAEGAFSRAEAEMLYQRALRDSDTGETSRGVGVLGFFEWCDVVLDVITPRLYPDAKSDLERWQIFLRENISRVVPDD